MSHHKHQHLGDSHHHCFTQPQPVGSRTNKDQYYELGPRHRDRRSHTPDHDHRSRSQTPDNCISSRPNSRGSGTQSSDNIQVYLRDCEHLVRAGVIGLPGGFTKSGHPLLVFPDTSTSGFGSVGNSSVTESDLHLLLKYYINVVPRAEQSPGFALVIDRRSGLWQDIQVVFNKIVTLFPAKIKEVFLLYQYPEGKPVLGQLVDDYLLDFDIFHVSHVTELLHYIDAKYLSNELGGTNPADVDTWLSVQHHVDSFTHSATKCARRMSTFVKILNKEDISLHKNRDTIREIAERNRGCYRRLRKELEDLTEQGIYLGKKLADQGATVMQRLAVQMLCNQLDNTWQYFTSTFKMQDHLYVQYVELYQFQNEFRELTNKFCENEKIIKKLIVTGSSVEEVNEELDKLDSVIEAFSVDVIKAKRLTKTGGEVMLQHAFARDSLEPKCTELKIMCKRQEILFLERRQTLLKFLDLFEALDNINKWAETVEHHLGKNDWDGEEALDEQDVLSQVRQLEFLLSKARDIKIKGRKDFEHDFDDIKDLISAKTLFMVDDHLQILEQARSKVMNRRDVLRQKATQQGIRDCEDSVDLAVRQEKVLSELLSTEESYVEDLHSILVGYKDRLLSSGNNNTEKKGVLIFGNLDEIYDLHSQYLLPSLLDCGNDTQMIARTFLDFSKKITILYCKYCQNMEESRRAVNDLGENHPVILSCQRELGHQLPLSSYLLKPVQRLTKYQLLLKELSETSVMGIPSENFEIDECVEAIQAVTKAVNDSLQEINIKGLPEILHPLGSLVCEEAFAVMTENKSQSQILFRNKQQRRHLLLYDNHLIFCKQQSEKAGLSYQFKFSLAIPNMGMSSIIKGDERKLEIWIIGQSDVYSLQAKTKKAKEDFSSELRKVIIKHKERSDCNSRQMDRQEEEGMRQHKSVVYNNSDCALSGTTSGSESVRSRRSAWSASKSLDQDSGRYSFRSHSLDLASSGRGYGTEHRSSSEAELVGNFDSPQLNFPQYKVLADYMAMTARELNLHQDEIVELIKIGCSGWWYIRLPIHPHSEGWAPSTYLEKIPGRQYQTLDRLEGRHADTNDLRDQENNGSKTLDRLESKNKNKSRKFNLTQSFMPDGFNYRTIDKKKFKISNFTNPNKLYSGHKDRKNGEDNFEKISVDHKYVGSE